MTGRIVVRSTTRGGRGRPRARDGGSRRTTRICAAGLLAAVTLAGSSALTPVAGASAGVDGVATSATWVRTLGFQALAQVSPGGIALDPAQNVYIANTGNDSVAMYAAGAASATWTVGIRGGPRALGSFTDPRDVAYMAGRLYVAEPGGVQVLDAATGRYLRNLRYGMKVPIGVSTGTLPGGGSALLVSDGRTGAVEVFDVNEAHVRTYPELSPGSGTRDADTDAAGNVYVADYRGDRINKFSPSGSLLGQWTGGTACLIKKPYGVEVDDRGRVFVAASTNNVIRVFSATGACLRSYGSSGSGTERLSQLRRVAVGSGTSPLVYAADLWGLKVLVYNAAGAIVRRIGDCTYPPPGGLNETTSVLADANAVYATDVNNHRIHVFRPDATISTFGYKGKAFGMAAFNWPMGLGLNPVNGNVWVGDTHSYNVKEFAPLGGPRALRQFAGNPRLEWPGNIAVDDLGNIYVVELSGGKVAAYSAALKLRWRATGLTGAQGIAFDALGSRLLVSTGLAQPIVALNPATGVKTSLPVRQGGAGDQLGPRPAGVAVAPDGTIWIGDTNKNRVVQLSATGSPTGFAFGGPGSAEGLFAHPMGLDFGADDVLYVADSWNGRIQAFVIE